MSTENDPYKVECDASDFATRAVLSQRQNKEWWAIAFFSKALTTTEQNYEIHNANKIEIITDYKNLEYFLFAKKLNQKQAKWSELFADYNYILQHQAEKTIGKLDALSRKPDDGIGVENNNKDIILISAEHIGSIMIETTGNQIISKIKSRKQVPINSRNKC